jgi:hypothetical protein
VFFVDSGKMDRINLNLDFFSLICAIVHRKGVEMRSLFSRNYFYLITLCAFSWSLSAEEAKTDYLAIMMGGQKIGYAVHSRTVEGSHVISSEEFSMTIGRAGQVVKVHSKETHVETTDGKPVSFNFAMKTSGIEQKINGTVNNGELTVTRDVLGQQATQVIDWPKDAVLMEGMRLFQLQRGLETGDEFEISIFRPEYMTGLKAKAIVGKKSKVDLFGRVLDLTEIKTTMFVSGQQITSTSYVDDDLNALKTMVPMMGMTMELLACDKNFAMQEDEVVDFLEKLSISSPVQLANLNKIESIAYTIKPTAETPLTLPESAHQSVVKTDDGLYKLTVRRLTPAKGVKFPYEGKDEAILKALKSTDNLQSDDKAIIDLAKHAVTGAEDAGAAAKQIESFVAGFIQKKDLSVGYASAAEVAQSRQGDCIEHAVLTAAMCRAVGIPARVVCGVVYADSFANQKSIFGGHMWVEAWIDNQWIGLDATRAERGGFGPGHITLAFGNGDPSDFFSLVNTLGCFSIEKIETKVAPKPEKQTPTAPGKKTN